MAEPTRIDEVSDRVRDFTSALRQAGAEDIAHRIDSYATGFVDGTQVRRSVDAIRQQLRYFRAYPEELPDLPVVHIAANRLEDACREALRDEQIAPKRLSLRAQGKRKLRVVLATLITAVVLSLGPLAVAMAGVDVLDLIHGRRLPSVALPKGSVVSLQVQALVPSMRPGSTLGVELSVAGECPAELRRGVSCRTSGERAFGSRTLPAFEILQPDQAYGLWVGFGDTRMIGSVGHGEVLVSAGPETPEGSYVVPLKAAFVGYAPARCNPYLQLLDSCTPERSDAQARHGDLPVATLQIHVVPGRPAQNPDEKQAEERAHEERRLADERAAQIAGALEEIKTVLDDTQKQLRLHHYELVQERVDKLNHLFEPLDTLAVLPNEADPLPAEVIALRARFESVRRELSAFRDRAFEAAYAALSAKRARKQTDEQILTRVAAELSISRALLDHIYAEHAEQLEQRQQLQTAEREAAQQRTQNALLQRCGPLPKAAWKEVQSYLAQIAQRHGSRIKLHECMTPRLAADTCWTVVCDFDELISTPGALVDTTKPHSWTFRLNGAAVSGHVEH